MPIFDTLKVKKHIDEAFVNDSEVELLEIIKKNSFLLSSLYERKWGIQPNFCEVHFGGMFRCDFCWLNDSSDGPEWVIVEIEKPNMKLFNKNGHPSAKLNGAIEQVKDWQRYFDSHPTEKRRIFGAVSRFRWILVAGNRDSWQESKAFEWRSHANKTQNIEIRSTNIFYDALQLYTNHSEGFWSFEDNPESLKASTLEDFWKNYTYITQWRTRL